MRKTTGLALVLALTIGSSVAFAQQAKKHPSAATPALSAYTAPFDFHGIQLGSTMAQFYAAEPPAFENASSLHPHDAVAMCSDRGTALPAGIRVDSVDADHGGGVCGWGFNLLGDGFYAEASFRVGNSTGMGQFQYIAMPGDNGGRLYHIHLQVMNQSMASVLNGLAAKFGAPTETRTEVWQNRAGARFDNQVTIWRNAISEIVVKQLALSVDEGSVDYILTDHDAYASSLKQATSSSRDASNM